MKINICGITHKVIEDDDVFNANCIHFGQIDFKKCEIHIAKDSTQEIKNEALCHEIIHGIFVHLGYADYSNDEQFVQALGNAINQSFSVKEKE